MASLGAIDTKSNKFWCGGRYLGCGSLRPSMLGHACGRSGLSHLIDLLVGWLIDFGLVPVGTFSSEVTILLTCETRSVVTQQYLRTRGSYRDRAQQNPPNQNRQPLQPVQPRQVPQPNVLPQPTNNPVPIPLNPQPMPNERQPEMPAAQQNAFNNRPCFACQQYGHFARECPNRDQAKV